MNNLKVGCKPTFISYPINFVYYKILIKEVMKNEANSIVSVTNL